ncbi:MAG: efflux RND transporter periplasmic adaptor subunit [Rhodobacteraceae bacterium]|nr:efflux RND transporter periplasmic adaptor subunit [Paracoccaceae bacterium]
MKFIHVFTALLVSAFLYAIVMERDALLSFAGVEPKAETTEDVAENNAPKAVPVVTMHSVAREVQSGIVLRGTTQAARRIEMRAESTGRVVSQPLPSGTAIHEGQVLCELDAGVLEAQLAEAHAQLANAEANNNVASRLAESGFGAENSAISASAALESARARVLSVERLLSQLRITAPFAGVLENDSAEIGSLLQPGGLCATILALDSVKMVGYVPEIDIVNLSVGQLAGARLLSGREVVGQVTFIARSADPLTRTFRLEVTVDNADLSILDGQSAEIGIAYAGEKAHLLPQHVLTLNDEGALGVRIDDHNTARFVAVDIIRDAPEGFWLTGLPPEVDVIVTGQEYVTDGRAIAVTKQETE